MINITLFENKTNRDNASLVVKDEITLSFDTTRCSEIMHHNFTSTQTLTVEEHAKIKISFYLNTLQALNDKCQFILLLSFLNHNGDKRVEKKNVIFSLGTNEYYDIYFQSYGGEKEVLIGFYINKTMKLKIDLQNLSIISNSKLMSYTEKEKNKLLEHEPITYINELSESWNEDEAIDVIKKIWQKRDNTIIDIFLNSHKIKYSLRVKIWLNIFIHMQNGSVPRKRLITFVLKKQYLFNTSKHKKELEYNILNLLIKINDLNFLEESFKKFKTLSYESLHIFYKLGILRLALNNSIENYLRVKDKFKYFSSIEKLKFYELDVKAGITPSIEHYTLLNQLKQAAVFNTPHEDFHTNVYEPLNKILTREKSKKLNFFDYRRSALELSCIYSLIAKAILLRSPFSLCNLMMVKATC